jgi:hypothetical protein
MALGNYGTQRGGQGEAVILNPQSFYNNLAAENRYKRQQAAINDRIAAKQKADEDKVKKEELYKMSSQTGGPARYLAPYAAQARQQLNERTLKSIEKGEPVNENALRLEYNAIDALEKQGLATGEDIDRRIKNMQTTEFIKPNKLTEAYVATLDEQVKKHLAEGKPYSTFVVDNNDLINKAMATTQYDIYDPTAINKKLRELYPNRRIEQPKVPGKTTGITTASPFYKTDPKTGLATKELDFDIIAEAFSQPSFRDPVNQMFAMQLTKADSPYFIENTKLKQQFANDPDAYAAAQEKLKADFVRKDMPKLTYLTSDALLREPSSVATSRPSGGGRGKQPPKVVIGNAAPLVIKSYTKGATADELAQELLSVPIIRSSAAEKQAPIMVEADAIPKINLGEDLIIKKTPILPQSDFDLANPQYTVFPILKKDITVKIGKKPDGTYKREKIFKKGTVIGQGDQFTGENKDYISLVANEAAKGDNINYQFGALIPTYARQTAKLSREDALAESIRTKVPVEEIEAKFESKKLATYRGMNFFERDLSEGSIFSRSWSNAKKNLYGNKPLEQIERELKNKSKALLESEAGIKLSKPVVYKTANRYKAAQAPNPVAPKTTPLPADNLFPQ